jgi:hypothetical protein
LAGGNYSISYTGDDFTIDPAVLTIAALTDTKTYDASVTSSVVPSVSGLQGSDTASAVQVFDSQNAGARTLGVVSFAVNDGNGGNNYTVASLGTASGTINLRPITVTADAKIKSLGNPDPALTYQITSGSLAIPDSFAGALARAAGESAGNYPINQGTLAASINYAFSFVGSVLEITPTPSAGISTSQAGSNNSPPAAGSDVNISFSQPSGSPIVISVNSGGSNGSSGQTASNKKSNTADDDIVTGSIKKQKPCKNGSKKKDCKE